MRTTPAQLREIDEADRPAGGAGVSVGLRAGAVALLTAVLGVLIVRHTRGLDGPPYAHWGWHAPRPILVPFTAFALLFVVGMGLFHRLGGPSGRRAALARTIAMVLLMISALGFTAISAPGAAQTHSPREVIGLIESPMAVSYFADAAALHQGPGGLRDWLANYPQLLPQMYLHSREKPPGLVLFFVAFIHFFGVSDRAALASALVLLVLIPLAIPATYFMARQLGAESGQAFYAAGCMALFPSIVRFYPGMDALWAGACALLLGLWARGLRRDSLKSSAAAGAVLAGTLFCVYNILVIGAVMAAYGLMLPAPGKRWVRFFRHASAAVGTLVVLYALLWLVSGFDPIATFASAAWNQAQLARSWNRPYPLTIPWDLAEFLTGVGWIGALLAIFALKGPENPGISRWVLLAGLLQIVLVALTGLLPAETARVWAFLTPLVAIPAGVELARWNGRGRAIAWCGMLILLALLSANLISAQSHLTGG